MLYKFTGAGNDFVVIDGRKGDVSEYRQVPTIKKLCQEYSTDGLMILLPSSSGLPLPSSSGLPLPSSSGLSLPSSSGLSLPSSSGLSRGSHVDFVMEFYNPDGSGGMMCGNGGRCITAFADMLGLKPASPDGTWHFLAPDGPHVAKILDKEPGKWTVRLKMIDVEGVTPMKNGFFLNTGTRHYVEFRDNVDSIDMEKEAKPLRWDPAFQPEGTNVNFVERREDGLHIRTYEKGVEGETLACGTGITASAIASTMEIPGTSQRMTEETSQRMTEEASPRMTGEVKLQCRRGDWLTVEFKKDGQGFKEVYLTGPAELVKTIEIC